MSLKSAFYNTYSPITTNPPSLHTLHPHPHHQATTGDESRHMRALLDSQHAEVATLTAELTTVQAQLTSILAEKTTLEDEDRSLKMTHKQTVAELERVQEVTRQLEEEIEMTRVELKGTTAELLTFKSSLDSAEALLSSQVTPNHPSQTSLAINPHNHPLQYTQSSSPLPPSSLSLLSLLPLQQEETLDLRAKEKAYHTEISTLTSDNDSLRMALESTTLQLTTLTKDLTTSRETEAQTQHALTNAEQQLKDLESTLIGRGEQLSMLQRTEAALLNEVHIHPLNTPSRIHTFS